MDWVFIHEGGYAERDSEPGGAVNMGISFTALKDVWKRLKVGHEPTFEDLKQLQRGSLNDTRLQDAEDIYSNWFFTPLTFDTLPSGVDYALVDFAVNSGVGGCLRAVTHSLNLPVVSSKMTPALSWALRMSP